ncbi:hypothetical protein Tco_0156263 [Tanacetum coccineum]
MIVRLGQLQPNAILYFHMDIAPQKKAIPGLQQTYKKIIETIHVDFDELTAMTSEHSSSGPALHEMTPAITQFRLLQNLLLQQPMYHHNEI